MSDKVVQSPHFEFQQLADGVIAAISNPDGLSFSNSGIIDLGGETLVLDTTETHAAAGDLRKAAETFFGRPVTYLVISHPHGDHWNGSQAFEASTRMITQVDSQASIQKQAANLEKTKADPSEIVNWIEDIKARLETEEDERVRVGLETSIRRTEHVLAHLPERVARVPEETFETRWDFQGTARKAELVHIGAAHSPSDSMLYLPDDGILFIADIGFFQMQPFMGFCDLAAWRVQIYALLEGEYEVLVPGHGPVGGKEDLSLILGYFDALEEKVGAVINAGGSVEDAMQIELPAPFDGWLMGGMGRFERNVHFMFQHLGGELPNEE